ncbi:hypothetical protein Bca101_041452 [Brassica carinata]
MSLEFGYDGDHKYPDFFYISNSFKQLSVKYWVSDECMDKILSGCPVLESLTLYFCDKLLVLDLSKSLSLRTLVIDRNFWAPGPTRIIAPHIHCLKLKNSQLPCNLVDVSSLKEARMEICFFTLEDLKACFLQNMVLRMLEKLQHVDTLTFGENFLKVLTLAELRGVTIPSFKVKDLTLKTMISQYVIPGIARLLQNSPELKKLTAIHKNYDADIIPEVHIDKYLDLQILNKDQRWSLEAKHVASFMEIMCKNTKTLEKMVVWLDSDLHGQISKELLEIVPMLSDKNNVSIVINSSEASVLNDYY